MVMIIIEENKIKNARIAITTTTTKTMMILIMMLL